MIEDERILTAAIVTTGGKADGKELKRSYTRQSTKGLSLKKLSRISLILVKKI